jgi:hypothetical protein
MSVTEGRVYVADKETLDKVYNILAVEQIWGFVEHMNVKSPSARIEAIGINKNYKNVTRDGSTGLLSLNDWADFPIIKANKAYMVKPDGTPDYMLYDTDYSKKADGTTDSDIANVDYDGGAFSWFPKIYKHEHMEGDDRIVLFSMTERDGYDPIGFIDPDGKVLEGVWLPMFYGSIVDDKMRSLSGLQPCYGKTTEEERTAIQNFSTRACHLGGPIVETIIDILMMMAGSTNLQATYGLGNSSGYDASLTPTMGVKQNAIIGGGQFYGTDDGKSLNKIFHSIVLGSFQQWMRDPYEIVVNGRVKVSKNYTYDLTAASYSDTGIDIPAVEAKGWCYPLRYQTVPGYGSIPALTLEGGSTSMGSCDGLYRSASQDKITAVALRFGRCVNGLSAGPRARNWSSTATHTDWNIGAADLLLPPVGVAV